MLADLASVDLDAGANGSSRNTGSGDEGGEGGGEGEGNEEAGEGSKEDTEEPEKLAPPLAGRGVDADIGAVTADLLDRGSEDDALFD